MAKDRDDFESANRAVYNRWEREKERSENRAAAMKEAIETTIANVLKSKVVKSNIALSFKEGIQNPKKLSVNEGFKFTEEDDAEIADWLRNRGQYVDEGEDD